MDIRRIGAIKDRDEIVGNQTRVKVVKNKLAPPFKTVEFDIMYNEGISKTGEILDLASKSGIIEKAGAWYSYNGDRIGQGRENAKIFLKENKVIADEIEKSIRSVKEDVDSEELDKDNSEKKDNKENQENKEIDVD